MFRAAAEVSDLADGLILEHHEHLAEAPIVFIFRATATRSKGRMVLGRARLVKGLYAFLASLAAGEAPAEYDLEDDPSFFVMEIAEDWWAQATAAERAAVVDHELCHMAVDPESGDLELRGHDLEEFEAVVARHGLWRDEVVRFFGACGAGAGAACSVA